jgi:DNA (cytosine-5)-methyltransferase 1
VDELLELFSGAGGAGEGYARAGWKVTGVDLAAQPRYPFEFHRADAITYLLTADLSRFDAIHASPPCQSYTSLRTLSDNEHPDLVWLTRWLLEGTGLPWVIENVPGAPIRQDYVLCGSSFGLGATCRDGVWRQLRRHRWFETSWPARLGPECKHEVRPVGVYGHGGGGQMTRGYKATLAEARECMDCAWMNRREVSQAIPPAYTELIGAHLMEHLHG